MQVFCSMCLGPTLDSGRFLPEWLQQAVLLTSAHSTENGLVLDEYIPRWLEDSKVIKPGRLSPYNHVRLRLKSNSVQDPSRHLKPQRVLRLEARVPDLGVKFDILASGEVVSAYSVKCDKKLGRQDHEGGSPLYIPVHPSCLNLADYFVYSKARAAMRQPPTIGPTDGIKSIEDLWETMYRRLPAEQYITHNYEPNMYYGGSLHGSREWDPDDGQPEYGEMLQSDPMNIPGYEASLAENLELLPDKVIERTSAGEAFPDFSDEERQAFQNMQNLSLECEFTRSQDSWQSLLSDKNVFPWLWELNLSRLPNPLSSQSDKPWNWELLVRKLSQVNIHEPDVEILRLPPGLRNRRRIWRLLEEARIGDMERDWHLRW